MPEHRRSCCLCEALCGVVIDYTDTGEIRAIRGNPDDPLSRGHICPKGAALKDIHEDPDRLRSPRMKINGVWRDIPWDMAIRRAGEVLHVIQEHHGRDAVALYAGNPNAHHYSNLLGGLVFRDVLDTRNQFSATSLDQLPHQFAALFMFGHQLLLPVPDLDRTELFVIVGGNPAVSNGSIMTAPDFKRRARAIQQRGGRLVVVDPRRSETAAIADEHLFIRPGTDPFFLLSVLHVFFDEDLVRDGPWQGYTDGIDTLAAIVEPYAPERTVRHTGVSAESVRKLARAIATTERVAVYGRVGVTTQRFGGLNAWLLYAINIVGGHFDTPGGVMFTTPAVDLVNLTAKTGHRGSYDRWRSRVSRRPEFGGELPAAALVEELETPGSGQVKAVVTIAGNPVLSAPGSARLDRALASAEFVVAIDPYLNETSRHADIVIPPPSPLERDHYGLIFHALAVRNTVKYAPRLFDPPKHVREEWETLLALARRIETLRGDRRSRVKSSILGLLERSGPQAVLDLLLRFGPHGSLWRLPARTRVTIKSLMRHPDGFDLGPLEPRCPEVLHTANRRIDLVPSPLRKDLQRLRSWYDGDPAGADEGRFLLIGRRQLRSNNSWLHNSPRLMRGPERCTLLLHPDDAKNLGIADGETAHVQSKAGSVVAPVEITEDIMVGVVSLPHGWGHDAQDAELRVAAQHPGTNINAIIDVSDYDALTGTAALNAGWVSVRRAN